MIRIGNILINPDSVDTITLGPKPVSASDKERGIQFIQVIYKSGVVKNISSCDAGMSYEAFIDCFEEISKKAEDTKILRIMAAINQNNQV